MWRAINSRVALLSLLSGGGLAQTACTGGVDLTDAGSVSTGGAYAAGADCSWRLACSDATLTPRLTFSSFDVEAGFDFVKVYHGDSVLSGEPTTSLDSSTTPDPVTGIRGSALALQLGSNDSIEGAGFHASFDCVTLCAAGTYGQFADGCTYCPKGTYAGHSGSVTCVGCETGASVGTRRLPRLERRHCYAAVYM